MEFNPDTNQESNQSESDEIEKVFKKPLKLYTEIYKNVS